MQSAIMCIFLVLFVLMITLLPSLIISRVIAVYGSFGFVSAFIAWQLAEVISRCLPRKKLDPKRKAVLISGCDSGFGHAVASRLHREGYTVFAGCLFPHGEGALSLQDVSESPERMHVIALDVTKEDEVEKAVNEVKKQIGNDIEFWGLINNAGIALSGMIEWGDMDVFKRQVEVNQLGVVRLTKAFLPLLRKSKGRIVVVTSFAGRITFPGLVGYCMSKYAVESFAEGLRREVHRWNMKVITIQPSMYKTTITSDDYITQSIQKAWNRSSKEVRLAYGQDFLIDSCRKARETASGASPNIGEVVDAMVDAIVEHEPILVRKLGTLPHRMAITISDLLPVKLRDFLMVISGHGSLPDHWLCWLEREFLSTS